MRTISFNSLEDDGWMDNLCSIEDAKKERVKIEATHWFKEKIKSNDHFVNIRIAYMWQLHWLFADKKPDQPDERIWCGGESSVPGGWPPAHDWYSQGIKMPERSCNHCEYRYLQSLHRQKVVQTRHNMMLGLLNTHTL